ncbi:MAG: DNA-binding protein [Candidatus Cloacimonetes bacterium]|nr:DNA-binding protein [Candidatus Cloacimonadota bacterium]
MRVKKYHNIYFLKLQNGEDFVEQLLKFAKENELKNVIILNGIGMLKDAKIGYYENGKYISKTFTEPVELISTNGNMFITPDRNRKWHIHIGLAEKSHKMFGGHMLNATVWNVAEIFVQKIL